MFLKILDYYIPILWTIRKRGELSSYDSSYDSTSSQPPPQLNFTLTSASNQPHSQYQPQPQLEFNTVVT